MTDSASLYIATAGALSTNTVSPLYGVMSTRIHIRPTRLPFGMVTIEPSIESIETELILFSAVKLEEPSSTHSLTTSSAINRSVGGNVKPSFAAVLRLSVR